MVRGAVGFKEGVSFVCGLQEGGQEVEEGEDKRVSVIETSTGNKLTGEDAPLKSELEKWLQEHPG